MCLLSLNLLLNLTKPHMFLILFFFSAVWLNESTNRSSEFPEDVIILKLVWYTCPKTYKSEYENCGNVLKKNWSNILNSFFGLNLLGFNLYFLLPTLISSGKVRAAEMP